MRIATEHLICGNASAIQHLLTHVQDTQAASAMGYAICDGLQLFRLRGERVAA